MLMNVGAVLPHVLALMTCVLAVVACEVLFSVCCSDYQLNLFAILEDSTILLLAEYFYIYINAVIMYVQSKPTEFLKVQCQIVLFFILENLHLKAMMVYKYLTLTQMHTVTFFNIYIFCCIVSYCKYFVCNILKTITTISTSDVVITRIVDERLHYVNNNMLLIPFSFSHVSMLGCAILSKNSNKRQNRFLEIFTPVVANKPQT